MNLKPLPQLFGKKKNSAGWWKSELAKPDLERSMHLYKTLGSAQNRETIQRFLLQFEALNHLLIAYNKSNFHNEAEQFLCICSLLEKEIKGQKQEMLLQKIREIGFEKIRHAFSVINQDCENPMQEKPDLFYFIKKHRLNEVEVCSDEDTFKYVSYYFNVTLINFYRIKNLGLQMNSRNLAQKKDEMSGIINPLVEAVFEAILDLPKVMN